MRGKILTLTTIEQVRIAGELNLSLLEISNVLFVLALAVREMYLVSSICGGVESHYMTKCTSTWERGIMQFLDAVKKRRSYYKINKDINGQEDKVIDLVKELTKWTPDPFNQQMSRVVVVLGEKQDQLWDLIYDTFGGKVPREKIDGFKAGYGTILYYIDTDTVKQMQENFPSYADKFPTWSHHANGMLQFNVWTGLRQMEIGASLQHYNSVIDENVRKMFDIPASWELVAQMPFGGIVEEPEPKEKMPIEKRVFIKK